MKELLGTTLSAIGDSGWLIILIAAVVVAICIAVIALQASGLKKLKKENMESRAELNQALREIAELKESAATAAPVQSNLTPEEEDAEFVCMWEGDEIVEFQSNTPRPQKSNKTSGQPAKPSPKEPKPAASSGAASSVSQTKFIVLYDKEKRSWIIKKDGNNRPTRRVATKEEAMSVARELCKKYDANLQVHKRDGKFQKH